MSAQKAMSPDISGGNEISQIRKNQRHIAAWYLVHPRLDHLQVFTTMTTVGYGAQPRNFTLETLERKVTSNSGGTTPF